MHMEELTPQAQQVPMSVTSSYEATDDDLIDEELEEENEKERKDKALWSRFVEDVKRYEKLTEQWYKVSDDIIKKYSNEGNQDQNVRLWDQQAVTYNILWANVQTLLPALYSRLPKIVAERRWKDRDPIGRLSAITIQRAAQYSVSIEKNRFDTVIQNVVLDRLLSGRGIAWVRYEPKFEKVDDGAENPTDRVVDEKAVTDWLYYKDFGHTAGRSWTDVTAVWKRAFMSREDVTERFGKKVAKKLQYADIPDDIKQEVQESELRNSFRKAIIYERWDKERNKCYWFSEGLPDEFLEVSEPICHFEDFFPCPAPLYATLTSKNLVPIPDYKLYKQLADDLDYLVKRISSLTEVVRLVGCHDASINDLMIRLRDLDDGDSIPIKQWAAWAERSGFKGVMQWFPLEEVAQTINLLSQRKDALVQQIYEITGMSDIIRGNTSPYETATAQQIKGQFASLRLSRKQADVQRFVADLGRLKTEIVLEHFSDETIQRMIGFDSWLPEDQQLWPQVAELIRSDKLRTFRVDIETDSVLAMDEEQDKKSANEYIQATGQLLQQAFNLVQIRPELMPFVIELTKFGARRYSTGDVLEASLEKALDQITEAQQAEAEAAANQPPEPALIKAQSQAQAAQMKVQSDSQVAQQRLQLEGQIAQQRLGLDQYKVQSDASIKQQKMQMNAQLKAQQMQQKMEQERYMQMLKMQQEAQQPMQPEAQMAGSAVTPIILNINPGQGGLPPI